MHTAHAMRLHTYLRRTSFFVLAAAAAFAATRDARAQGAPTGAPPPEAKALVAAPKAGTNEPEKDKPVDLTQISLSAGGMLATGNSRTLALTTNGSFEVRRKANGFGGSLLFNYGEGAAPGKPIQATSENLQGRLRYDRYLLDDLSLFLITTGRYDRFQGLDFRFNLDPGAKYLFLREEKYALWAEAGYDFQFDVRRDSARAVLDASGNPTGALLDKTATDHSLRLFAGYRHSFTKDVTLNLGLEYLQSFVDAKRARLNGDVLFAAKLFAGFSAGLGVSLRYDNAPLPGKEQFDTATTINLIYTYKDEKKEPPPAPPAPPPTK